MYRLYKRALSILLIIILIILIILPEYPSKNIIDDNIIYIEDFLDTSDYEKIKLLDKDRNNFIFENFRYSKPLSKDSIAHYIFYDKKYIHKIQNYVGDKIFSSKFPIEHRFYHKESTGMKMHKDTLLYSKPQYEAIYTIQNNSKSMTKWNDGNGVEQKVWTKPNSLLVVKADNYYHYVTPPIIGEREILKLIYTQTNQINSNYINEMKRFNKFNL